MAFGDAIGFFLYRAGISVDEEVEHKEPSEKGDQLIEPKPSDRTQRTRAPEEETRRYVETEENFWVIVKKSLSLSLLWFSGSL
jgi:hypothetical protein